MSLVITGTSQVQANLEKLKAVDSPRARRRAMHQALKPLHAAARRNAPRATGLLARSLKSAVNAARFSGRVYVDPRAVLLVAPSGAIKARMRGLKKGRGAGVAALRQYAKSRNYRLIRASKYAIPLEFGHRTANGGFVAPRPFMRRAAAMSEAAIFDALADAVEQELNRIL